MSPFPTLKVPHTLAESVPMAAVGTLHPTQPNPWWHAVLTADNNGVRQHRVLCPAVISSAGMATTTMAGWIVPPPKDPTKTTQALARERAAKVDWLKRQGLLQSERIEHALLKVHREDFIPPRYRDYAYEEVPLPLPGNEATISCPHSYPLFYEPLGLGEGDKFLEVGVGSGYGSAVAREVVGPSGLVVSLEIDPETFRFATNNLANAGYTDIEVVNADGGLGYPALAPYDRIAITAACRAVPPPLIEQLGTGGRLIAPLIEEDKQDLVLLEKATSGIQARPICEVLYVLLRGEYAAR